MLDTESREEKNVNKHQGQDCSQKSAPVVLHEKLRMVSASSVRCESANNFGELNQANI